MAPRLNVDWKIGPGRLTSTTAWRFWDWNPSNDRDFIGLPVTTISSGTSRQSQWTQELRYAGDVSRRTNFVAGAFLFRQGIDSNPVIKQEQGSAAARFLLAPTPAAATPGLLDGYGFDQYLEYQNLSAALFGQVEWLVTDRLRLLPGLRLNYDKKDVDFDQQVYGGLQTTDPVLIALQRSVLAPQAYAANVDDTNLSGQMTVAFKAAKRVNTYATYATSFKSVGLNLNGVPTDALGRPVLSAATVKPEDVHHFEIGVKTEPFRNVTANLAVYDTEINDFQAQVVNADVGVLRGYLANAEKVRVRGLEFDASASVDNHLSFYAAAAYTDGKYVSFPDAPPPLEETGGPQVKDISGSDLPGISRGAVSFGGEYVDLGRAVRSNGSVLRRVRRELSFLVFVKRERVEVSRRRRLLPAERPDRLPRGGGLDRVRLVPEPAEQGLLRPAVRGAWQLGPLCGTARRPQDRRRDPAIDAQVNRESGHLVIWSSRHLVISSFGHLVIDESCECPAQ